MSKRSLSTQKSIENYPYGNRTIPYFSDYGFKLVFTKDSLFTRKALSVFIGESEPFTKLTMLRNELSGITPDARTGFYDVICQDERRRVFLIEMQGEPYKTIAQRLLFYTFSQFCELARKGKASLVFDDLPPIFCICIIKPKFLTTPSTTTNS